MDYAGNRVSGINIAYIGGGSRGWAWGLMGDLAMEEQLSGTVKLYDINYQSALDNSVIGNKISARDDVLGKWKYEEVHTLEEALIGAHFVVISILPGTFQEMLSDVHLPEQYGIYQSVGDTTGPGGMVRALRAIPMYVEIAEQIEKFSPQAWVINYTNPMALCTRTLYEVFPKIKAFGCCHEVFGMQGLLATVLKEMKGIDGINPRDIKVNVLGINHFTWIDQASYKEIDLMPLYKQFVDIHFEEGFEENPGEWKDNFFESANKVQFDLFRKYGLIPVAGDRHIAEFMPHSWYLRDPETVRSWKFGLTPVEWRMKKRERLLQKSKNLINGNEEIELRSSGEEGVRMIKSLLGLEDLVTNVNLPNEGQMQGIPLHTVVETNALMSRDNVRPLMAGQLPIDIQNLVMRHTLNQETILRASMTKDKYLAFKAFINDPLVTIDMNEAEALFTQMLRNTKQYLSGWDIE